MAHYACGGTPAWVTADDDDEDEGGAGEGGSRDAEAPESAAVEDAVREDADDDKVSDERSSVDLEELKELDEKEDEKKKKPTVKEGKADSEDQRSASDDPERSDDKQTEATTAVVTWVKHIDRASGKPYYHNPASNVTQWEEPAAFVDAPPLTAAALEYQAHVNRTQTERLARVTQRVLDPTGSLSRLNKILGGINPGGAVGAQSADATLDGLEDAAETTRRAEWQQHVEPLTQRFYYHNAVTGETQWHKPDAPIVSGVRPFSLSLRWCRNERALTLSLSCVVRSWPIGCHPTSQTPLMTHRATAQSLVSRTRPLHSSTASLASSSPQAA